MTPPALDAQIEGAWTALTETPRLVRFYFDRHGTLRHGNGEGAEVGWYSSSVTLADFRGDCYHEFELLRRARHG
jgi:hypothetical protein